MLAGLKGSELKELELCYAPPFSSAKDPCNMAGFMIENIEKGLVDVIDFEGLKEIEGSKEHFLLDVRTEKEYKKAHVEGFVNIPVDELRKDSMSFRAIKIIYVPRRTQVLHSRAYLSSADLVR